MREDYQEQLDKMFPQGYVIVYTFEKGINMRCHHYNPQRFEAIELYKNAILEKSETTECEICGKLIKDCFCEDNNLS